VHLSKMFVFSGLLRFVFFMSLATCCGCSCRLSIKEMTSYFKKRIRCRSPVKIFKCRYFNGMHLWRVKCERKEYSCFLGEGCVEIDPFRRKSLEKDAREGTLSQEVSVSKKLMNLRSCYEQQPVTQHKPPER